MTRRPKPHTAAQRADSAPADPTRAPPRSGTKIALVIDLLRRPGGATIADIISATGWQSHTVRGALAGAVQRRMGLKVISSKEPGETRRYYVDGPPPPRERPTAGG